MYSRTSSRVSAVHTADEERPKSDARWGITNTSAVAPSTASSRSGWAVMLSERGIPGLDVFRSQPENREAVGCMSVSARRSGQTVFSGRVPPDRG